MGPLLLKEGASRIVGLVHPVPVASKSVLLCFDVFDQLWHIFSFPNALNGLQDCFNRTAMQGPIGRCDGGYTARKGVSEGRGDVQKGGRRVRQLVICMKYPEPFEAVHVLRIGVSGGLVDERHHDEHVLDE